MRQAWRRPGPHTSRGSPEHKSPRRTTAVAKGWGEPHRGFISVEIKKFTQTRQWCPFLFQISVSNQKLFLIMGVAFCVWVHLFYKISDHNVAQDPRIITDRVAIFMPRMQTLLISWHQDTHSHSPTLHDIKRFPSLGQFSTPALPASVPPAICYLKKWG